MRRIFHYRALVLFLLVGAAGAAVAVTACETETPTRAVVENAYPELKEGGDPATQIIVYKAWWVATLFPDPVTPGQTSDEVRSVPAEDIAYAVLAPGWDPASTTPPTTLIPLRSKMKLTVNRGEVLRITVSDATFTGSCAAKQALSQEEADFITQRIFPGDFAKVTYDAKTCISTPLPSDGGAEAGDEGGIEAGPDAGNEGGIEGGADGSADAGPG